MADHITRFQWTEDYEIVLKSGRCEHSFKQLSGGEMIAPLTVRLALLCEVPSIDVVFFDKPKSKLDNHRRAKLTEQIPNVKGFFQLFVIDHDDAFECNTDNVVSVVKENGVS